MPIAIRRHRRSTRRDVEVAIAFLSGVPPPCELIAQRPGAAAREGLPGWGVDTVRSAGIAVIFRYAVRRANLS
jgi:hypothetical protein